jgi:hypothetical protein
VTHDRVDHVDHAELQAQLPAYVADALEIDERNSVAAHIAACSTCHAEVEELRLLMRALAVGRRQRMSEGPSIADAVMARIGSGTPSTTSAVDHAQSGASRVPPPFHETYRDDTADVASFKWERETPIAVVPRSSSAPRGPVRHPAEPTRYRQPRPVLAGIASLAVVALIAALLLSRLTPLHGIGGHPSVPGTSSNSVTGSWRAAYLGSDGRLDFVSAGGERSASVALPGATFQHMPVSPHVGISADGRYLAYIQVTNPDGSGPVTVVDLATGKITVLNVIATELHWAPDAPRFVCGVFATDSTTVTLVSLQTGAAQAQELSLGPASSQPSVTRIVGWIDATHLAVVAQSGRLTLFLASLDLTTKQTHLLASLNMPPDVFLSPDGNRVFIAPTFWNSVASVVDTTTGVVRALPAITATFASQLQHLDNYNLAYGGNWAYQWAWRPGSHTIALSLSQSSIPNEGDTQPVTQQAGVWLLDVDHDQARNLDRDRYPLAWTPDGQTLLVSDIPATSSLVTLGNTGYAVGPHLFALSPSKPTAESRALTGDMALFFGLVPNG